MRVELFFCRYLRNIRQKITALICSTSRHVWHQMTASMQMNTRLAGMQYGCAKMSGFLYILDLYLGYGRDDCDATISRVAFAMNHSNRRRHRIHQLDFSLTAWELNKKWLILFSFLLKQTRPKHKVLVPKDEKFRIAKVWFMQGVLFQRGKFCEFLT